MGQHIPFIPANMAMHFHNDYGREATAMFRVFAGIKYFKEFSGMYIPSVENTQKLAALINMPYRSVKININRLIQNNFLQPRVGGAYNTISNDFIAQRTNGGNKRYKMSLSFIQSNKETKTWMLGILVNNVSQYYEGIRYATKATEFIPRSLGKANFYDMMTGESKPVINLLKKGSLLPRYEGDMSTRVINKEAEVKSYNPIASSYLEKFSKLKASTWRSHANRIQDAELGVFQRVEWCATFRGEEAANRAVNILSDMVENQDTTVMQFAGLPIKSYYCTKVWASGKKSYKTHYIPIEMPKHFKGSMPFKTKRISEAAKALVAAKWGERHNTSSIVKEHCQTMRKNENTLKARLKGFEKPIPYKGTSPKYAPPIIWNEIVNTENVLSTFLHSAP